MENLRLNIFSVLYEDSDDELYNQNKRIKEQKKEKKRQLKDEKRLLKETQKK